MSNEELHIDGDFTLNIPHFEADFTENEQPKMQADFKIQTGGSTSFANITGDPYDNEALTEALNQKADTSTVETLSETVENNYAELDGKITDESDARTQADADLQSNIDDITDDLSIETDNRQTADADLQDNIDTVDGKIDTHIADKTNPHEVTKAQIGLGNVDNTSDLNKPISTATQTALNGKQNTISDLSEIRTNASNGQSAYNTIQTYGDIVTYDASNFATSIQGQKADTALQPNDNITELNNNAGYITGINSEDVTTALGYTPYNSSNPNDYQENVIESIEVNGTAQTVSEKTVNIAVPTDTSDLTNNAGYITSASLPTVNNNKVTIQKNSIDVGSFTLNQSTDKTINLSIPTQASDINAVPTSRKVNNKALSSDITLSASDVSALPSSTTINDLTTSTQQDALNSGATSINIGQIATNTSDITTIEGLIPVQATTTNQLADKSFVNSSIATNTANFIGTFNSVAELEAYSGTLTNNDYAFVETTDSAGNTLYDRYKYTTATTPASWQFEYELNNSSFTSNQWASINSGITSNDVTLIGTALQPNDNVSSLTNDAGYITSSSLPTVNNGILTIQQNGADVQTFTANQSTNVTANITVPTDTNDLTNGAGYITGIGSSDVISALGYTPYNSSNPNGYTSNEGTVTSVNNTQPDANGDVTLTIPTVNDGILTITQNGTSKGTFSANQSINDTIALTDTTYNAFTGADGTNAGSSGLVPAPSATDNDKYLKGDGTWASVSGGSSTDVQINGTSITNQGVANILTETAYNSSTNKIATMSDVPSITHLANKNLDNLSATGESHFLKNIAGGTNSLSILAYGNVNGDNATSIGVNSRALGNGSISLGTDSSNYAKNSIAIGYQANVASLCDSAIQLGYGTNSTAKSLNVGFYDSSTPTNYQLLDGTTGLIPDTRLSTNIARTSQIPSTSSFEQTLNKVTSITSSSTDTQYPSAKLLYDQLALKQSTSTAVTHTANTAVGNSTKLIYISSTGKATESTSNVGSSTIPVCLNNGTITSTGLSIASSRFDGQWVYKFLSGSSALAVGTVTIDLSSYLPSDSYKYEVLINLCLYSNPSSGATDVFLWSDVFQNTNTGQDERVARCNTNSRANENRFTMPVGTGRWIKRQIVDKAATVCCNVSFWGYRRIGTNT